MRRGYERMNTAPTHLKARYILFALFFASVLAFLDRQLLNILVRPIRADIGIDDLQFSLLQGASFSLVYAVFSFPLANLSDRYSRKKIIMICIAAWSAMAALFGLGETFLWLLLARMGLAIGEAALSPASISILRDSFSPERQAFAVAVLTISLYVGGGISMAIGGPALTALEAHAGALPFNLVPWRALFIACGLLGAVGLLLLAFMPEPKREPQPRNETSLAEFGRRLRERWALVVTFLAAFCGVVALIGAASAWTPAVFIRAHGWSEQQTGLSYGLVYIIGGTIGALSGGRLVGILLKRGVANPVMVILRAAAVALGGATVLLALAPDPRLALVFAFVAMLSMGPLVALGAFAFQDLFPAAFSARAVALYFVISGTIGSTIGPSAVPLVDRALSSGDDLAQAYSIFAAAAAIWSVVWLSVFLRLRAPEAASPARV